MFHILRSLKIYFSLFPSPGGGGAGVDRNVHLMHIESYIHQTEMEIEDA